METTEQLAAKFADAPSFKSLYEQIALPFFKSVTKTEPGMKQDRSKLFSQPDPSRQATKVKHSAQQQQRKDSTQIQSLQQEVETLKREKKFIHDKLEKLQESDSLHETQRLLETERSKSEAAEQARAHLAAELDKIKK